MAEAEEQKVAKLLTTKFTGKQLIHHLKTSSTNSMLLADTTAKDGCVVWADEQTAGRGRLDHKWLSTPGENLSFSVRYHPHKESRFFPEMSLVTAVALVRALTSLFPQQNFQVKWPNDIWLNERKLAGVLCEMLLSKKTKSAIIIGIGINLNQQIFPPEIADRAISLSQAVGQTISRPKVLATILNELEIAYLQWLESGLTAFISEWSNYSLLEGRTVEIEIGNQILKGEVCGVSNAGLLLLRTPDGKVIKILSGDVHLKNFNE